VGSAPGWKKADGREKAAEKTDPPPPPMGSELAPGHTLVLKIHGYHTCTFPKWGVANKRVSLERQDCGEEAAGGKAAVMRRTFKAREAAAGPGRGPRGTPTHKRGKQGIRGIPCPPGGGRIWTWEGDRHQCGLKHVKIWFQKALGNSELRLVRRPESRRVFALLLRASF